MYMYMRATLQSPTGTNIHVWFINLFHAVDQDFLRNVLHTSKIYNFTDTENDLTKGIWHLNPPRHQNQNISQSHNAVYNSKWQIEVLKWSIVAN